MCFIFKRFYRVWSENGVRAVECGMEEPVAVFGLQKGFSGWTYDRVIEDDLCAYKFFEPNFSIVSMDLTLEHEYWFSEDKIWVDNMVY